MEEKVIIEWTYTPEDYFEDEVELDRGAFKLRITNGRITASVSASTYDKNNIVLEDIHKEVKALFMGVQVVSHIPFGLSKYTLYRQYPDGRRDITVFPDPIVMKLTSGNIDFVVTDSVGNIVADSKADRIHQKLEIAKLSAKHRGDSTAARMLSSYEASVGDPDNELVHLYEIIDLLKTRFGSKKLAQSSIGISNPEWKRLGLLSNHEPLKQGRHRGQHPSTLRDANIEELTVARRIAKRMILAYLKYL